MKNTVFISSCILISGFLWSCTDNEAYVADNPASTIIYMDKPANEWNEAIPVGNGRLGGMVFGGITQERIQTNDDTFWSGEPRDLQNPEAYNSLAKIRQLILDEKNKEAQNEINKNMLGPYNQNYLPLADIVLDMKPGETSNYRRELDLNRGIVTVTYTQNGVNYKREIFSSFPDQTIVIQITADKANSINLTASLESAVKYQTSVQDNQLIINGQAPKHAEPHYQGKHDPIYEEGHGMRFQGRLLINQSGGELKASGNKLGLQNASSATLLFAAATSYNGFDKDPYKDGKDENEVCMKYIEPLKNKKFNELYKNHIQDYQSLFSRVSIDLGNSPEALLPIDQRIKNYTPEKDPALTALYFQFGRYLLISSSRPGSQPANLQGIWNHLLQPAWSSNWTINCNAQLNYWPVESANLSECHLPLIDMIQDITVDGTKTAQNLYRSRGWMAHHNVDIWKTTWPVGGSGLWAIFQVGGAWLCQHIWDHYQFTMDKEFLQKNYPVLKNATLFYIDNLQKDKDGYLVTNPSESFENGFVKPDGKTGWACMGSAQDMQIIRALFKNTMQTIDILGEDKEFKNEVLKSYEQLAPMKISPRTGQLQEWNDDWDPANPASGQVGHGWAFAASNLITLRGTPELAQAFRKTIEYRKPGISYNSGSWTGAFPANFWARFEEGDSVQQVIDRHFKLALFPNLTCNFTGYWEIDGNLGFTAAIAEMLLQSHAGEINLLPALPSKYPTGSVKGLKARGGYTVDIYWKEGVLTNAVIKPAFDGSVTIRYKDKTKQVEAIAGKDICIDTL